MIQLVVLDTETGGLNPKDACIIELAASVVRVPQPERVDGGPIHSTHLRALEVAESFHAYVKPDRPVNPQAASVNGYTEEAWSDAPSFGAVAPDFVSWLYGIEGENLIWCGSHVDFDLSFLRSDLHRLCDGLELPGKPKFTRRVLNTESLCFPLLMFGKVDSLGVNALGKWAGREGEQKHRAMDDVNDTVAIVRKYLCTVSVLRSQDDFYANTDGPQ